MIERSGGGKLKIMNRKMLGNEGREMRRNKTIVGFQFEEFVLYTGANGGMQRELSCGLSNMGGR